MRYDQKILEIRQHTKRYVERRMKGEDPRNYEQFLGWVLDVYGCGVLTVKRKLAVMEVTPQELDGCVFRDGGGGAVIGD